MVRPGSHRAYNRECTSLSLVHFNQQAAYKPVRLHSGNVEYLFEMIYGYARTLRFYARCGPGISNKSLILIVSNKTEYQITNFLQQSSRVIG